jgi:hypothetical protein
MPCTLLERQNSEYVFLKFFCDKCFSQVCMYLARSWIYYYYIHQICNHCHAIIESLSIKPLRHGVVVSSPPATGETGVFGREIESRTGNRVVAFYKKVSHEGSLTEYIRSSI